MPSAPDRIDHVHVCVADRTEAERRYGEVLHLRRDPALAFWSSGNGPLMLRNPTGSVMIALFEREAQPCRSTIAFRTDGGQFLDWRRNLETSLGRSMEVVDHEVAWSTYFADPFGNPFEITCYDYDVLAGTLKQG